MSANSVAFLSYAHRDDTYHGGAITRLREELSSAIAVAIGDDFSIFQDRKDIAWGEHWPSKLEQGLAGSRFLIPILSPSFFSSDYCRKELSEFLEIERMTGRQDLILPIYFVSTPFLESPARRDGDPLAKAISARQYRDWRDLRHVPFNDYKVRRALDSLAEELTKALGQSHPVVRPPKQRLDESHTPKNFRALVELFRRHNKPLLYGWLHGRARLVRFESGVLALEKGDLMLSERRQEMAALLNDWTGHSWRVVESEIQGETTLAEQEAEEKRRFQPGNIFRDIEEPWCPEMVAIPVGSFVMGSPPDEEGHEAEEEPEHRVYINRPCAIGLYPVTFDQFDHFCIETRRRKPGDQGWGRGRRPVVNVNVEDVDAYLAWISDLTGRSYSLPSEATWEYACRAGTITAFATGKTITTNEANYDGNHPYGSGKKGAYLDKTTEVGSFPPNSYGLYDMHGNVWERCADYWHESYDHAPVDGSPWFDGGDSDKRVLRGGYWGAQAHILRSARRAWGVSNVGGRGLGFRCTRFKE